MIEAATLMAIRTGVLIGQIGWPILKDLIGMLKEQKIDLPALETILEDIAKDQKAADAATDAILKH